MTPPQPDVGHMFAQQGLSSDAYPVAYFLQRHTTMGNGAPSHEAVYWILSRATFLREAIEPDGDWSCVVDQLNLRCMSVAQNAVDVALMAAGKGAYGLAWRKHRPNGPDGAVQAEPRQGLPDASDRPGTCVS